jgi:hypothetical protein
MDSVGMELLGQSGFFETSMLSFVTRRDFTVERL